MGKKDENEFPKPKYKAGDKVFAARRAYKDERIQCPDCLGTLKWTVVFADGEAVEVDCQTCRRGYEGPHGVLYYKSWQPSVETLTIGTTRYDDEGFSYMCNETGIGSGTIWRESKLFTNRDDAEIQAQIEYEEGMKRLAQNNFSKRFGGKKKIEEMLSTFGFTRSQKVEKAREFIQWAQISGLIKKSKQAA